MLPAAHKVCLSGRTSEDGSCPLDKSLDIAKWESTLEKELGCKEQRELTGFHNGKDLECSC